MPHLDLAKAGSVGGKERGADAERAHLDVFGPPHGDLALVAPVPGGSRGTGVFRAGSRRAHPDAAILQRPTFDPMATKKADQETTTPPVCSDNGAEALVAASSCLYFQAKVPKERSLLVEFRTKRGHGNAAMRPWQER
jgi:hypothetical protein